MEKIVLGFRINAMKAAQIDRICRQLGMTYREVEARDFGKSLGTLAGIAGLPQQTEAVPVVLPEEVLVFSGADSSLLDEFLAAYRAAGIPKVELKAVITPYNIFLNAGQLYQELAKERAAIKKST